MRSRGRLLRLVLVVGLLGACHRREESTIERAAPPITATATATAKTSALSTTTASALRSKMTPELTRILEALRARAGHRGEVRGTLPELRKWIGPDSRDWPLANMLMQLDSEGEIAVHVLSKDAGADPAFVLSAWRD